MPPPVSPVPAVTPVMSPPLSLSTSSANPAGLFATPDQGTADAKAAFGDGVSSWRPASVVYAPVLAPGRTRISSQRLLPANTAPKSSDTVNRPFVTTTSSRVSVEPDLRAAARRVEQRELQVVGAARRVARVRQPALVGEGRSDGLGVGQRGTRQQNRRDRDRTRLASPRPRGVASFSLHGRAKGPGTGYPDRLPGGDA